MGYFATTSVRFKELYGKSGGLELHKISQRPPYPQNRIGEHIGKAVLEVVLRKPGSCYVRVTDELSRQGLSFLPRVCGLASTIPP
jgi:hypothetical protein